MSRPRRARLLPTLALALAAGAGLPATAAAGPPWIAVELPANPHDAATRGALAVVRLYHHGTPTPWPLDAYAVGMVGGARRTVPLAARPLAAPGVVAVHGALPRGDGWVLVLTMRAGPTARAAALVALDRGGQVAAVRVPQDTLEGGRWINPREARAGEVDAMLRVAVAGGGAARVGGGREAGLSPTRGAAAAGLGLAVLAPVALARRRRR